MAPKYDMSHYVKRRRRIPVKDILFYDHYIVYNGMKIDCYLSKKEYNIIKLHDCGTVEVPFSDNRKLIELCKKLNDLYYRFSTGAYRISASVIDFYDDYFIYNGERFDDKRSKFRYNVYPSL